MSEGPQAAPPEPARLRQALQRWYRAHGRHDLPWRLTRDPYAVLVSEVMLQQTQVERVRPYYEAWMERWPTVTALARAPVAEVIRHWAGLGYNRRAVNLHRAAQAVAARDSLLPESESELRALPGIGAYTAAAIACFAGGQRSLPLDTNVGRVIARACLGAASNRAVPASELEATGRALLPARNARDHGLALMDLGATVCTARAPRCEACPLRRQCAWLAIGSPADATAAKPAPRFETTARFARGRIVDLLRDGQPRTVVAIAAGLPAAHRDRVPDYLAALARDGLAVEEGGAWTLPQGVTAG